jgi:acetyl-CoA carboxylase biotin carboxyl carrier protein
VQLLSPMGGTYYTAPAPGEPAFVKEGDKVTKGQTVGIIEAMKLMNEIEVHKSSWSFCLCLCHGHMHLP